MQNGSLQPCPSSPNCVSSLASSEDRTHYIEPLKLNGSTKAAWTRLAKIVRASPRVTIVKQEATYLRAEFRSGLFRFVDDLECLLDTEQNLIHWRSASRVGYSDLGANRRRLEKLRTRFFEG